VSCQTVVVIRVFAILFQYVN